MPRSSDESIISYLKTGELPENDIKARSIVLTADEYYLSEDEILCHLWEPTSHIKSEIRSQLVRPATLWHDVLYQMHDEVTAGHFGLTKTYEKLRQKYYWKNMYADFAHYIRSCA